MDNNIAIKVENLSKKFCIGTRDRMTLISTIRHRLGGEYPKREIWALQNINFTVKKGEMVVIIGPNGAGKTTLLRILSGIMSQTSGRYEINGETSCMFELGLGFNSNFSAIDNIYLYGALLGMSKKEIDKKLNDIIDFSELGDFMGAKLSEFSSGMSARLAFATVIQTVKGIVMVDEALAVGDLSFQKKCITAFENILNKGNTILFISHGIRGVNRMCKNALYINRGIQIGFGEVDKISKLYMNNSGIQDE
ncbi:MAG: ATP-binding cassette domain-containing protein [Elusimicrobia bacterium]|nr:ATP-binding cassette domain-containing protein [Candidatus Liberimonas magnetica]